MFFPDRISEQRPIRHDAASPDPERKSAWDGALSPCRLLPLHEAMEAFAARVALIRAAQAMLDVQYYIWHGDLSGALMLEELEAAADRGVAVRLLLDDNGVAGLDARLAALTRHPMIQVRLFNPFPIRTPRALSWLLAFRRLNRRMHAKSLTADDRFTILGGRNVGDEYFDAKADGLFEDLDVLTTGPVVADVRAEFERHWTDPRTLPAERVLARVPARARKKAAARDAALAQSDGAERYRAAVRSQALVADMEKGEVTLFDAPARIVANGPFVPTDRPPARTGIAELLPDGLGTITREIILVSGYFVPTISGCDDLARLSRSGVRVRVLTNSFAATDVGLVHAGYAPCRATLLAAGIELSEMPAPGDRPKTARKFIRPGSKSARAHSGRSLHAKLYIVDRRRIYIGSANFDPRSAHLNSELGLVIDSPDLAGRMSAAFERAAQNSYRLSLGSDERLRWTDMRDDDPEPERVEPGTGVISRALVRLLSRLGLEGQM